MSFTYTDMEPAIDDARLLPIADEVRRAYRPWLDEAEFATARVTNPQGAGEVWFVITTLWQKEPQRSLGMKEAQIGRTLARDWDASEKERKHHVGKPDPARAFFMLAGKVLSEKVTSMRQLITDDIDKARDFGIVH